MFPPSLSPDGRSYAFAVCDGSKVQSIALYQSPAPGKPWVAVDEFIVPENPPGSIDPWRSSEAPLSDSIGIAWSPDSCFLFVASADPMTIWKLDARSALAVAFHIALTPNILTGFEFSWMASSLCLSETGEHVLLKSGNHGSLLALRADRLRDPVQLRQPQACTFFGKGSGLNWGYKLPGDKGPWLGVPSLRHLRNGARYVPIDSDMVLKSGSDREPLLWYSLTRGKCAQVEVEEKYLRMAGNCYRGYGMTRQTAFDGRWFTFSSEEKGAFYCVDTRLLATFKTGPLNRQRFFSACKRISIPVPVSAIEAVGVNLGKRNIHDRPWLTISTEKSERWLSYIEGNDLILEAPFSQYRIFGSRARCPATPVSSLLAAGADGVSVLTLSISPTNFGLQARSKRLLAVVGHKRFQSSEKSNLPTMVCGPASICFKGPGFLPRNQRVLVRWLERVDAGIARRAPLGHRGPHTACYEYQSSWLHRLSMCAPNAFDLIRARLSLTECALLTLAYPDLSSVAFGSTGARLTTLAAWIEFGMRAAPAALQSSSREYEYMGDAALDLLIALTEAGDRMALQMALYAYRMGVAGASSECEVVCEQRSMASALAARLAIVEDEFQYQEWRLRRELKSGFSE